jgi:hypothetical protein
MEVINFDLVEPGPFLPQLVAKDGGLLREIITTCPYFTVERVTFAQAGVSFKGQLDGSTFEIWGVMSGMGRVIWAGEPVKLPAVRFALLPAVLEKFEIEADQPTTMLRVYVPEP